MKKFIGTAVLGGVMLAGAILPAISFASSTVSDNASANACFGQARAYYAQGGPNGVLPGTTTNGTYISQRKGDNPSINAQYIKDNCSQV